MFDLQKNETKGKKAKQKPIKRQTQSEEIEHVSEPKRDGINFGTIR